MKFVDDDDDDIDDDQMVRECTSGYIGLCTYISLQRHRLKTVRSEKQANNIHPGHPFVGGRNEYQPKGGDALWLGSKGRYGSCVGGR